MGISKVINLSSASVQFTIYLITVFFSLLIIGSLVSLVSNRLTDRASKKPVRMNGLAQREAFYKELKKTVPAAAILRPTRQGGPIDDDSKIYDWKVSGL